MAESSELKQTDDLEQMVTFNLGQEEFGVNILQVQEINRMVEITQVPQTENYVEGIINLRGKVIPIINLRKKFGMADRENDNQTRIVVVDSSGEIVGMVVDGVSEVLRVHSDSLENAPGMISGSRGTDVGAEYIQAIVKLEQRLLIYLNLENIIGTSKFPVV